MSEDNRNPAAPDEPGLHSPGDEAEWRLKSIIEGTNVGSWEWNVQTGETRFNERWAEIIGYSLDELGPTTIETWVEYAHPEDLAGSNDLLERHFAGELSHYDIECRMRHRDGHWVWVHDRGRVFSWTPDGKPEWMFGTHQDITDRKRAEEERVILERQLMKAQKMESLGVLAGGIAHDFNNIFGAILGYTQLTLMDIRPGSPEADNLQKVVAGIDRATRLTNQMLAYSGRGNFVVGPVDLPSLIAETTARMTATVAPNASLRVKRGDQVPLIEGDQVQLNHLLLSLLENAVDALDGQPGTVTLDTGVMHWEEGTGVDRLRLLAEEFGQPADGRYAYLEISDTGHGMTPEVQRRFLEPFFTTKFQGRGLGMAAAQGIIRAHRGGVFLQTEPGQGTRIRVIFPVQEEMSSVRRPDPRTGADAAGEPLGHGVPLGGLTVLVVDDEPEVREVCTALVREAGAQVRGAPDGEAAVAEVEGGEGGIDLVLLDVTMPGMDGRECLRRLRELRPELPVILMSGYSEGEVLRRQREQQPDGFLQKPFTFSALTEAAKAVLNQAVAVGER